MGRPVSVIVRQDGSSWSAWSPQCPGLAMVQPAAARPRDVLPEVLAWYFGGDTAIELQLHQERELAGVVVRIAQDDHLYDRELVAERLAEVLGGTEQRARRPGGLLGASPEATVVCALQSDRIDWLDGQMEPDDAVVALLPVAETMLWAVRFGAGGHPDGTAVPLAAYPPETMLGVVMRHFAGPRQHLRI